MLFELYPYRAVLLGAWDVNIRLTFLKRARSEGLEQLGLCVL